MPIADGPRAASGYVADTALYGDVITDLTESIPALAWPESVRTYNAMRNDPQIEAILSAYSLPLRSATWCFDPAGCRDEVVQMCADAYGLPILGDDESGSGPFRRRGVLWDEHLDTALDMLIYGHMPFAIGGEVTGQPLRWKLTELSERLPSTITRIDVNPDGTLKEVLQFGSKQPIPASNLLWYAHRRRGGNWTGRSMLRSAYAPWLLKHEMWRVIATGSRRFGTGIPAVSAPAGATDAQHELAARLASAMRVGDQSGIGLPQGYTAQIIGMTGSFPDTLGFVRYLDQQMAQSVLASVLNLDASPNGSRALGDVLVRLLRQSWAATAKEIAIPANRLAANMVDWNYGEDEAVPRLIVRDLDRPDPTAEAIKQLMDAGAIKYDPNLEAAARDMYQLPQADPDYEAPIPPALVPNAATDPNAVEDDQAPDGGPAGQAAPKNTTGTTTPVAEPAGAAK